MLKNKHQSVRESEFIEIKKTRVISRQDLLTNLNNWLLVQDCILFNASISEEVCAGLGLRADNDIITGELIFEIPRSMLLIPENSNIGDLLLKEINEISSRSGWIPLLLTLLHEYNKSDSKWKPYFDLIPDFDNLDLPMFWSQEELNEELKGTGIIELVERDLLMMKGEFEHIVLPFIKKYKKHFAHCCFDFLFFQKMVAFIMAYSFSEPRQKTKYNKINSESETSNYSESEYDVNDSLEDKKFFPPMIVPLADMLNHMNDNNAKLVFKPDSLVMIATQNIKKGDEIFNTYGELTNAQLLHMYGFSEKPPIGNVDTVDLPVSDLFIAYKEIIKDRKELENEKWKYLIDEDAIYDTGAFTLDHIEVLTSESLYESLKVLTMTQNQFIEHKEKRGWTSDEEHKDDVENQTESLLLNNYSNKLVNSQTNNLNENNTLKNNFQSNNISNTEHDCNSLDDFNRNKNIKPSSMKYRYMNELPEKCLLLLLALTKKVIEKFPQSMEEEEIHLNEILKNVENSNNLSSKDLNLSEKSIKNRKVYSAYVRLGQLQILNKLETACTVN